MVLTASLGNVHSLRCARSPASVCAIGERTSDRKRLIFTAFDPIQGRGRKLAQFDTKPTTDAGYAWDLSPDGTRIAIVQRSDSTIHLLSLGGRAPAEVVVKGWSSFQTLDWTAEGKGVFVSSTTRKGSAVLQVDLEGNAHLLGSQREVSRATARLLSADFWHLGLYLRRTGAAWRSVSGTLVPICG